MNTYSIRKMVSTAVLPLAVSVPLWAGAADYSETTTTATGLRTATVNLADLNLSSVSGQQAAQRRISQAAVRVCGSTDYRRVGSLYQVSINRDCQQRALSEALAQLPGSQEVAALAD